MAKKFFIPEPRILAHRGLSKEFPENTLLSFRKAVDLGVDVIETDVHFTRDNKFVVVHDDRLERISDGEGDVSERTLDELKKFDAAYNFTTDGGETYPYRGSGLTFLSLQELLEEFPEQRFNVDLKGKDPRQISYYGEIMERSAAQNRVLTASEHLVNLREIRRLFPEMATSFSMGEVVWFYFLFKTGFLFFKKGFKGDALQIPEFIGPSRMVNAAFVRQAHAKGVRVHVWTINEEDDMKRLLDAGVDGIFTDDPKLLMSVLQQNRG
jgi:glycerophosphoryl diester phosphodiesterase